MRRRSLLALPLFALLSTACIVEGDDVEPRSTVPQPSDGRIVTIALPDTIDQDQIREIARHVESAGNIATASVRVTKQEDHASLTMELWGSDLPTAETLTSTLRSRFPALASAEITVGTPDPTTAPQPLDPGLEDEDPDVVEATIRDQLRDKGVADDEATVDVIDDEQGRQIEVRVEKTLEGEPPE